MYLKTIEITYWLSLSLMGNQLIFGNSFWDIIVHFIKSRQETMVYFVKFEFVFKFLGKIRIPRIANIIKEKIVLKRCIINGSDFILNKLALTLLTILWAKDSPGIVSSSIVSTGKSLDKVALFKFCCK